MTRLTLHWLREPSPHLVLAPTGARKSSSYLLDSHPAGSTIPIDSYSASASTIAQHTRRGPGLGFTLPGCPALLK